MQNFPPLPALRLSVTALGLSRGGLDILSGLCLEAGAGEAVLIRGANGVGKSSLLLALGGHLPLKSGTIQWFGTDEDRSPASHMHFVGHLPAIQRGLSVAENLAFWITLYGGEMARLDPALQAAGLGKIAALSAGVLSAGQTRRLALARLVAIPRPVWLLDEPSSALDAQGAAWVADLLRAHLEAGGLALAATHLDLGIEADGRVRSLALEDRR